MRLRGIISLAQKKAQHFFSITRSLHTELNCCLWENGSSAHKWFHICKLSICFLMKCEAVVSLFFLQLFQQHKKTELTCFPFWNNFLVTEILHWIKRGLSWTELGLNKVSNRLCYVYLLITLNHTSLYFLTIYEIQFCFWLWKISCTCIFIISSNYLKFLL